MYGTVCTYKWDNTPPAGEAEKNIGQCSWGERICKGELVKIGNCDRKRKPEKRVKVKLSKN
jgi:hypothetical protein